MSFVGPTLMLFACWIRSSSAPYPVNDKFACYLCQKIAEHQNQATSTITEDIRPVDELKVWIPVEFEVDCSNWRKCQVLTCKHYGINNHRPVATANVAFTKISFKAKDDYQMTCFGSYFPSLLKL